MPTYQDLKSADYIKQIISFAEEVLGIRFKRWSKNKYKSLCPFHHDTDPSLSVYVNEDNIVRFRCFGGCKGEWDIYDLIQRINKCRFGEAQEMLAQYIGVGVELYKKDKHSSPAKKEPESSLIQPENDEPSIAFTEPKELSPRVISALEEASLFYHEILLAAVEDDGKPVQYLQTRGVDIDLIQRYTIGFSPRYASERYEGRALIKKNLERFKEDNQLFRHYCDAGLMRLLNDDTNSYYKRYIDFSKELGIFGSYGDYFATRLTFPIHDIKGQLIGMMGRKQDNRGTRWIKQMTDDTDIQPKFWLYGIDKAHRYIKQYSTMILVEGIFDYFAVLSQFQDRDRPIVVSTLGSNLTDEAMGILQQLDIKNYIVAYDWDRAGRAAKEKVARKVGGGASISYLGGMKDGDDPHDLLKGIVNAIDGFSLSHLLAGAKKAQALTDKPVHMEFISVGRKDGGHVTFSQQETIPDKISALPDKPPKEYVYDADAFLPLLSYDHGNKAELDKKLAALIALLQERPVESKAERVYEVYSNFVEKERFAVLGPALILWLKIAIEQRLRKRKLKMSDIDLAEVMGCTRKTISKYKGVLKELGYLSVDDSEKIQKLTVSHFPK